MAIRSALAKALVLSLVSRVAGFDNGSFKPLSPFQEIMNNVLMTTKAPKSEPKMEPRRESAADPTITPSDAQSGNWLQS
jgi:hypothetical protein